MNQLQLTRVRLLRSNLLCWFAKHGRRLPWRSTEEPFHILLAEMLLKKTQVCQVEKVYPELVRKYGTPARMASARTKDLRRLLRSLGLKSRVGMIKEAAETICGELNGEIPKDRRGLKRLKGIGDYAAGAYLAQAENVREWFVDGNVARVFTRYFGLKVNPGRRNDPLLIALAKAYIQSTKPRTACMALLDFGALVCTPTRPRCPNCSLKRKCRFYYPQKASFGKHNNSCQGLLFHQ